MSLPTADDLGEPLSVIYEEGSPVSHVKGKIAEDAVTRKLRESGWSIEERNYRRKGFELDIIASRHDRLICIEVKARKALAHQHPTEILRFIKIQKLAEGMSRWLQEERPQERRNAEFWLCSVLLPLSRNQISWYRLSLS